MTNGGDAAEQVVRLSLEGFEVAAKLTGTAAKELTVLLVSVLKQEQKKYSYGRKAKNGKVFSTKIKLPAVCDNGKYIPDWEHMENFIKNMDYVN